MTKLKSNMKPVLDARIDALKASEGTTFTELGAASRELLQYIPSSDDIGMANRLIKVLSPTNRKGVTLYLRAFLPWNYDETALMFTKKDKSETRVAKKLTAIDGFLADADANYWTWAERNITVDQRNINYAGQLTALIKRGLADDKANPDGTSRKLDARTVFNAVIVGGVSLADLLAIAADAEAIAKAEAEKAANAAPTIIEGTASEVKPVPAIANDDETSAITDMTVTT